MSVAYRAVGWSPLKRRYDAVVALAVVAFLAGFVGVGLATNAGEHPDAQPDAAGLLIRGLGLCALLMLHAVLWIGPLARLAPSLTPLLYNRRHLGVATFALGAAHAAFVMLQYHGFGDVNPLVSLLAGSGWPGGWSTVPFEWFGAGALLVLFLMAATSHDFWLSVLSPRAWKWLHMSVYGAYGLLVVHVALGVLQQESHPLGPVLLLAGVIATASLHVLAARRQRPADAAPADAAPRGHDGWIDAGAITEIPLDRARAVVLPAPGGAGGRAAGERVALFRYRDGAGPDAPCRVAAISGVCAHQQGPLAEGKVIDGCVTCPWHGYQYRPHDGCAPPPFTEKLTTYRVRLTAGRVEIDPRPLPPGTFSDPPRVDEPAGALAPDAPASASRPGPTADARPFFVGYLPVPASVRTRSLWAAGSMLLLGALAAALAAWAQAPAPPGVWREERVELVGRLHADPYPWLATRGPDGTPRAVLLVAPFKHGLLDPADYCGPQQRAWAFVGEPRRAMIDAVAKLKDRPAVVRGTLLERQGRAMIEIDEPPAPAPAQAPAPAPESASASAPASSPADTTTPPGLPPRAQRLEASVTLRGEIVDPKCYYGAMKPGSGATHRLCAVRCVSGGIAPILVARFTQPAPGAADAATRGDDWVALLLTRPDGSALDPASILHLIAYPVEVRGTLTRWTPGPEQPDAATPSGPPQTPESSGPTGELWTLAIEPSNIRRTDRP